jgi:hypothetical protein
MKRGWRWPEPGGGEVGERPSSVGHIMCLGTFSAHLVTGVRYLRSPVLGSVTGIPEVHWRTEEFAGGLVAFSLKETSNTGR